MEVFQYNFIRYFILGIPPPLYFDDLLKIGNTNQNNATIDPRPLTELNTEGGINLRLSHEIEITGQLTMYFNFCRSFYGYLQFV